jgi:hypothetical protein
MGSKFVDWQLSSIRLQLFSVSVSTPLSAVPDHIRLRGADRHGLDVAADITYISFVCIWLCGDFAEFRSLDTYLLGFTSDLLEFRLELLLSICGDSRTPYRPGFFEHLHRVFERVSTHGISCPLFTGTASRRVQNFPTLFLTSTRKASDFSATLQFSRGMGIATKLSHFVHFWPTIDFLTFWGPFLRRARKKLLAWRF